MTAPSQLSVELPYGRAPLRLVGASSHIEVLAARELGSPAPLSALIDAALARPISSKPLDQLVQAGRRVTLIISDITRDEPRGAFVAAVRERLPPSTRLTIAVATGTHGPCDPGRLGLSRDQLRDASLVMHDGHSDENLVELGTTTRGTPVRVHRAVIDADLVIATGCIRPHYFAGFGAGIKAIFPGLGQAAAIRINHRLKLEMHARAGVIDGNPCRDDLVEAVAMIPTPKFLLDGLCSPDGRIRAVVAGEIEQAFREGAQLARPWFTVEARPAPLVIASEALPVTASLYQAAKIAAAVAPLVCAGGQLVLVAECADGIGPLEVVNEAIFRTGVLPRLPSGARLDLVSSLSRAQVETTLVGFMEHLPFIDQRCVVVPRASQLICRTLP